MYTRMACIASKSECFYFCCSATNCLTRMGCNSIADYLLHVFRIVLDSWLSFACSNQTLTFYFWLVVGQLQTSKLKTYPGSVRTSSRQWTKLSWSCCKKCTKWNTHLSQAIRIIYTHNLEQGWSCEKVTLRHSPVVQFSYIINLSVRL